MSSRLFNNVLPLQALHGVRTELRTLLLSPFDSIQGIPVEANQPLGCKVPIINLNRPAVLRVYFGISKRCTPSLNIVRPTYGPISTSSSVGIDPHNFTTKPMSLHLYTISEYLRKILIEKYCGKDQPPLQDEFNHCTVLVYSGTNNNGTCNSSLAFHSDCTFDHNGNYISQRNSQKENTCVVVLTVGDRRTINFKKRVAMQGKHGRYKWKITDDCAVSFELENNSVFLLHPRDEKPTVKEGDDFMSQYIHGGINIETEDVLSFGFVFRVVCIDREYNPITSKLIPTANDLKDGDNTNSDQNRCLRSALHHFRRNYLNSYSTRFQEFVRHKFNGWNW